MLTGGDIAAIWLTLRLADHMMLLDRGRAMAVSPITEVFARADLPLARGEDAIVKDRLRATTPDI